MKHFLLAVALFSGLCAAAQPATFLNPVIAGDMADPTVIRVGETYYATGTSSEWAPFFPLYASKDLVNWKPIGHLFDEQPAWTRSSFWAPELFTHKGLVYAYYTARRKSDGTSFIGVATAKDPAGPYTDHGPVVEYGTEAIDAFVLEDGGKLYISWKAYGLDKRPIELLACRLTDDGLRLDGKPFSLLRDDERRGMEGQHWLRLGEWYYIVYAVNGCCGPGSDYAVSVARSKKLRGPYEKFAGNPILHGGGGVQACGHGTITTTPDGRMFFLFHAYETDRFPLGRRPFVQQIVADADGWLRFPDGETACLTPQLPFEGTVQEPLCDFADDFTGGHLRPEWSWNYPFATPDIELLDGRLCLSGTPKEGVKTGTALCLRPASLDFMLETARVDRNGGLAGLTVYGNDRELLVWGVSEGSLVLRQVRGGVETALCEPIPLPARTAACLRLEVRGGKPAAFGYSTDGRTWQYADIEPAALGDPHQWDRVARSGLYYQGPVKHFAEFEYFRMINR